MNNRSMTDYFDVVVMLTWSNWKTGLRSHCFHYASRFVQTLPVLVVQPKFIDPQIGRALQTSLLIERTELEGVEICHYDHEQDSAAAVEFLSLLRNRGYSRPLVCMYNPRDFSPLITKLKETGNCLFLFQVTEDCFTPLNDPQEVVTSPIQETVRRACADMDIIVCGSDSITRACKENVTFHGRVTTIESGCEWQFASALIAGREWQPGKRPSAVYQGEIDSRVDFQLLHEITHLLPDWDFLFCGKEDATLAEWRILKSHPNVEYLDEPSRELIGERLFQSTVGLIPYVQDEQTFGSLPFGSYEYPAYGLPVVTVPIAALKKAPSTFFEAKTAAEFVQAMIEARALHADPAFADEQFALAEEHSNDRRFDETVRLILGTRQALAASQPPLNVVMLYDDRYTYISTIQEHLDSFRRYSKNIFHYLPATGVWPATDDALEAAIDLSLFDVVIVHYSVRLCLYDYFTEGLARQVERHNGLKILFIQDEYERTETARRWMERLQFHIVYTCVPESGRELIYPSHRFPGTEFLSTLTGYVPESGSLDQFAIPIEDRALYIGYRGRELSYIFGELGYEKYRIGVDVKRLAEERLLPVDIETGDAQRIYGDDWYRFLGSARATLGTESGSNVFDYTGEVAKAVAKERSKQPGISFAQMHQKVVHKYEGPVEMNQVSPKIFEAIRLRTALVLFDGEYSGVVQPDVHFIPLRKDYSNIDEVFTKLEDLGYLAELTDRAYRDVIESGRYSYRRFVEGVDANIAERQMAPPRLEIVSVPAIGRMADGTSVAILASTGVGFALSTRVLGGSLQREQVADIMRGVALASDVALPRAPEVPQATVPVAPPRQRLTARIARKVWRVIPAFMRTRLLGKAHNLLHRSSNLKSTSSPGFRLMRLTFRALPLRIRAKLLSLFTS